MNRKVSIAVGILAVVFMFIDWGCKAKAEVLSLREFKNQYQEKKEKGYDLTEAERLRREARKAKDSGDYRKARELLRGAFKALKQAKVPSVKPKKEKVEIPVSKVTPQTKKIMEKTKDLSSVRANLTGTGTDPFEMSSEFKTISEEIEPPELQVTGVMKTRNNIMAVVKLNLGNYVGTVILEEGQKVSMPNPRTSESDKWISYFLVKEITEKGIVIVLENKKEVYLPVLGARD